MTPQIPLDVSRFLETTSSGTLEVLAALASAESLTDPVAIRLATVAGLTDEIASSFVHCLHFADFVIERNSEWNLSIGARNYLRSVLMLNRELFASTNALLLELAQTSDPSEAGKKVPRYLTNAAGQAYHQSVLSPREGLAIYAKAATFGLSGEQWLLAKLAVEQQQAGIIPSDAIEPPFLHGITLYQEGRSQSAEEHFEVVIRSLEVRIEVAICCHLLGRILSRRSGGQRRARELLQRSLDLGVALNNKFHQAVVLHSLAQLVRKNSNGAAEAEDLLRQSLALGLEIGNQHHQAQVLHSLGQLIGNERARTSEAEKLLEKSLAFLEQLNDPDGQAQVLHTLGQLVGRNFRRINAAETLLRRSLAIDQTLQGKAQVLHTLGQVISHGISRDSEAEVMLRESIELLDSVHDFRGKGHVLHSLGLLVSKTRSRQKEAQQLLTDSLQIGIEQRDSNHMALVYFSLAKVLWGSDLDSARKMIELSRDLNRKIGSRRGQEQIEKFLRNNERLKY